MFKAEFRAFCTVMKEGEEVRLPPVYLQKESDVAVFLVTRKELYKEIVIEDTEEFCVGHTRDGKIIHPKEFEGR